MSSREYELLAQPFWRWSEKVLYFGDVLRGISDLAFSDAAELFSVWYTHSCYCAILLFAHRFRNNKDMRPRNFACSYSQSIEKKRERDCSSASVSCCSYVDLSSLYDCSNSTGRWGVTSDRAAPNVAVRPKKLLRRPSIDFNGYTPAVSEV